MPQAALTAVVFAAQAIGTAASATAVAVAGASAATLAAGAALASIAYTSYSAKKAAADARKDSARAPRDITVRSAIEPARIIYGTARTSGPVVYTNTAPTPGTNDNSTLWTVISLCQHEIEDITEIWLDGDQIPSSLIRWSIDGGVSSGKYGPIGGNYVTNFYRRLGTDTQTHVTELATAFSDWTSAYDGKGVAYIVTAFELGTATGEGVWAQGAPQNIRAVVKGKKVYDPRKDSTAGGSGVHRLADPTTWEWSDNPALCLADYLFDARLGMGAEGVTYDDIDWDLVADAADVCDATVTVPGGTEKRYTCNGALSTGETYAENIKQLLSSMSGQITWSGGKYRIRAAAYEAPTYTFTGDDVIGDVQIQPERTRTQRYNKIRGTYIDPESDYVATEFIPVENTSYKDTRDGGQTLTQEIRLPFTNSEYMAQRIAFKQLNLNNQQLRCIVPFNWKAMKVAVGDRIQLTIDELSWSNKVFRVDGWQFSPESGFNLELQEDSSSAYADPLLGDYSTRTLAGVVSFADQAVSAPSGLQATSEEEAIFLEWEAPPRASGYDEVIVFASASSAWSGASEIARTRGNTYRHELDNGTTRYYWVRAVDVDGRLSTRDPDSDTSSIVATAGQISTSQLNDDANFAETANWPQITGTGKPEDNATRNVIYQQSSAPTGSINDGDIWIDTDDGYRMYLRVGGSWVDRSDTRIGDLISDVSGLEGTIDGKVTTFLQNDPPTAEAVGDLWIDTNDANKLYRWSGSSWVQVRDAGIAQALTDASNAQATADGKIVTFYQSSQPTADGVGDIWFDTDDNNKMYRWNGSSWQSVRDGGISQAISDAAGAQATADGKVTTFYQDGPPTAEGVGDLWIDTNDDNKLYRWSGSAWTAVRDAGIAAAIADAAGAQATADGKIVSFYQDDPPTAGAIGDIWFDTNDDNKVYRWNGSSWISARDAGIAQALADAANAQSTADGKIVTFYQDGEPSSADEGDLWIDTNDDNKLYRYNGSAWVLARDSGIASAISAATTAQDTADGKVTTFYAASGAPPTAEATGDLWYQTDTRLFLRWNGSSWQQVASYNTGLLADKDTVAAGDIDEGAVQGKTIALLLNKNSDGTANSGEGAFVGVNNAGEPVPGTDGFIIFDNVKYNIPRNQVSSVTFATQRLGKKGYVVFDAAGTNFYIQAGGGVFTRVAFVYKEGSTWYYDDNSNPNTFPNPPTFTPGSNHLAIAFLETDPTTQDVILRGGLLAEPIQLLALSEIRADYISAGTLDANLITVDNLTAQSIQGDISTFVTFADTSSQLVIEDDGETVIQTFLLPGNSLGLQPIIIATAYFIYNTGMDQNGKLIFRVRQGQNSTTGTVVSTLIIHTRVESGVIEAGSINIVGIDSAKTANQYYSITARVDSGNLTDGATFYNVRGVVIGGR